MTNVKRLSFSGFVGIMMVVASTSAFNAHLYASNAWNIESFVVALALATVGLWLSRDSQAKSSKKLASTATTLGLMSLLMIPVSQVSVWILKLCALSCLLVHLYTSLQD